MKELFRKIQAGELPFTAQVRSESEESSTIQIGKVVVSQGGVQRILSEDMLTLSTNQVPGDRTQKSMARISLPVDGSLGSISTVGNATVGNGTYPLILQLSGGAKKLKASSPTGAFAIAQIRMQRDTQLEYFDFLFGMQGQSETIDDAGRKNRSHIALYPDGNGKFLRLEGSGCEITSVQEYSAATKSIIPRRVEICSSQFQAILVAEFTSSNTAVELVSMVFKPASGNA